MHGAPRQQRPEKWWLAGGLRVGRKEGTARRRRAPRVGALKHAAMEHVGDPAAEFDHGRPGRDAVEVNERQPRAIDQDVVQVQITVKRRLGLPDQRRKAALQPGRHGLQLRPPGRLDAGQQRSAVLHLLRQRRDAQRLEAVHRRGMQRGELPTDARRDVRRDLGAAVLQRTPGHCGLPVQAGVGLPPQRLRHAQAALRARRAVVERLHRGLRGRAAALEVGLRIDGGGADGRVRPHPQVQIDTRADAQLGHDLHQRGPVVDEAAVAGRQRRHHLRQHVAPHRAVIGQQRGRRELGIVGQPAGHHVEPGEMRHRRPGGRAQRAARKCLPVAAQRIATAAKTRGDELLDRLARSAGNAQPVSDAAVALRPVLHAIDVAGQQRRALQQAREDRAHRAAVERLRQLRQHRVGRQTTVHQTNPARAATRGTRAPTCEITRCRLPSVSSRQ